MRRSPVRPVDSGVRQFDEFKRQQRRLHPTVAFRRTFKYFVHCTQLPYYMQCTTCRQWRRTKQWPEGESESAPPPRGRMPIGVPGVRHNFLGCGVAFDRGNRKWFRPRVADRNK